LLKNRPEIVLSRKHIVRKYALIFVLLIKMDFPTTWPEAFNSLVEFLKSCQNEPELISKVMKLFVGILLTLEEEVVERNEVNKKRTIQNQAIKDAMRDSCIAEIVSVLKTVIENEPIFGESLVNDSLLATAQLIDWTDLKFFECLVEHFK
jgi:hypothetical protein